MKQLLSRFRMIPAGQAVLLRGHLTGQVVLWLATLCYSQLYGAEAYGTFALFLGLVNVCGFLACLGFEIALLLPDDEEVADRLFSGCFIVVTILAMLMWGLLHLFLLSDSFSIPVDWLMLAIWGQGILVVQHEWYTRHGDWKSLGGLWQTQYVLIAVVQGACFFFDPVCGLMVGYALTLGFLGGRFCWLHFRSFRIDRFLLNTLRTYWPVVCLDLGGRGVQLLAQQIQPFLILPCFGPKKAAHFFLAQQLLGKPLQALMAGHRSPFLRRSKGWVQQGDWSAIRKDARRVVQQMAGLILPFWCSLIIALIVGDSGLPPDWQGLGPTLVGLLPCYLGKICFSPVSGLAPLLRKTHWTFTFNGFLLGWSLFSLVLGFFFQAFQVFLGGYSVGVGLGYVWLHYRFTQLLKQDHVAA